MAQSFENNQYYRLTTVWLGEGKSLDVLNDGTNAKIHLANSDRTPGQMWKITPVGNDFYRLTNRLLGEDVSLDVLNDGTNNQLRLTKTGPYTGQFWKMAPQGNDNYRLTTQWQGDQKSLDVINDGKNDRLQLAKTGPYSGQIWIIKKITSGDIAPPTPIPSTVAIDRAPQGYTKIATEGNSYTFDYPVDVAYGANGKFRYINNVSGKITFDNGRFGDPLPGVVKSGYFKRSQFSNPSPIPTSDNDVVIEEVPDMPQSDINAVMKWIKLRTIETKLPYCYRQSYGRGVGEVLECPPGYIADETGGPVGLCYPKCKPGYQGVGPVCWQKCPEGFRDDGGFCAKPAPYGRGAGYPWKFGDKAFSLEDAKRRCEKANKQGCEKNGAIYYPKCRKNYHNEGCCVCSPDCPSGFGTDIGVSCTKKSYGRGVGVVRSACANGLEKNGALCYPKCRPGYHGEGPVCWQDCANGMQPCGAGCAKSSAECAQTTFDQVFSVAIVTANVASLGMTSGGTAAVGSTVRMGTKTVTGTTRLGKSMVRLASKLKSLKNAPAAKKLVAVKKRIYNERTKKVVETATQMKDIYDFGTGVAQLEEDYYSAFAADFSNQTSMEINNEINRRFGPKTAVYLKRCWGNIQLAEMSGANGFQIAQDALGLVSIVDPSGVVGVVSAYTKPICGEMAPFPSLTQAYR